VFPNNWFSTHAGGHVAVHAMRSPSRRRERRSDVIEQLKTAYRVQDVIDYSGLEQDGLFLEGTGAMVLDHIARVAYTARSHRADPLALERFCTHFRYEPTVFDTADASGQPIYHTNVLMCVATTFAAFAGNAIELSGQGGRLVPLAVPTVEMAGGSVRCMIAGVHLSPRQQPPQGLRGPQYA